MTPPDTALPMPTLDWGIPFSVRRHQPVEPGAETSPSLYSLMLEEMVGKLREAQRTIREQQERIDHLQTLTQTDELTGLLNRRGFLEAFGRELAAVRRGAEAGVLVLVDLDGFKGINDRLGHLAGDHYLRQVARALRSQVRAHDIVARLGGDEFVVLLTRTAAEPALGRAGELAALFNSLTCRWGRDELPLCASFGAEPYDRDSRAEDVVRQADVKMYASKSARKAAR